MCVDSVYLCETECRIHALNFSWSCYQIFKEQEGTIYDEDFQCSGKKTLPINNDSYIMLTPYQLP